MILIQLTSTSKTPTRDAPAKEKKQVDRIRRDRREGSLIGDVWNAVYPSRSHDYHSLDVACFERDEFFFRLFLFTYINSRGKAVNKTRLELS